MFSFTYDEIYQAYKWLKRDVYYDNVNLFLRKKIAQFEVNQSQNSKKGSVLISTNIKNSLKQVCDEINHLRGPDDSELEKWLDEIDFKFLPKKINEQEKKPNEVKTYISNLRERKNYDLDSVNYFADIPIKLHLLVILWINYVGRILDDSCIDNCLGYRLERINKQCGDNCIPQREDNYSFTLFKYYVPLYNKWRDSAIDVGIQNLKNDNDILLIALDIKECFYNNEITDNDWEEINHNVNGFYKPDSNEYKNAIFLNKVIKKINEKYTSKISIYLLNTHYIDRRYEKEPDKKRNYPKTVLPIGITSSHILNNWKLTKLDHNIINELRPVYFGRYVDDILIIINNPDRSIFEKDDAKTILKKYFQDTKILDDETSNNVTVGKEEKKHLYRINLYDFLYLQKDKLIFHYYDHNSSWAGLKNFQNELEKQASEFRFLPEGYLDKELSDDAYEIEYEGSINTLRSVIGVKENSNKLVNFFYEQILKYWLTGRKINEILIDQISRFYKGINIINNINTWERVFTLLVGVGGTKNVLNLYCSILKTIKRINYLLENPNNIINEKIIDDLKEYLNIAVEIPMDLLSESELHDFIEKNSIFAKIYMEKNNNLKKNIKFPSPKYIFRKSQLIRHQFVSWPLIEYFCNVDFSLCKFEYEEYMNIKKNEKNNIDFSFCPRYIYFDDFQMLRMVSDELNCFIEQDLESIKCDYREEFLMKNNLIKELNFKEDFFPNEEDHGSKKRGTKITNIRFADEHPNEEKKLCVGIVNIKILEENIKSKIKPPYKPYLRENFQDDLFKVLNESNRKPKCDLIIFPELSIPIKYISFMIKQSRRFNIGMVFGAEHITIRDITYNLVFTILPTNLNNQSTNIVLKARNKNHYSPKEKQIIESYGMLLSESKKCLYNIFTWRNCIFTVFNCYELSDIQHRGLFREKIDLLIDVSWNQDTPYYSNILESAVRDIHCYAVNVNTSQFGDSRILLPKKTELKNLVQITGGENCTLIKGILNIQELRDFQKHDYVETDEVFKPTPAGFDHDYVRKNRP